MQQDITKKSSKRLVFYFTVTGNSLYVAKQFSDNPLSIPQVLKRDGDLKIETNKQ